jgi:signal transduction histidine kinase
MARPPATAPSGHTILVVDDQEETRVSVRALLERAGHRVITAESGRQTLEALAGSDVDLIILDYFMPRMTGAELVREIRAANPFVQIILQTGYAGEKPPLEMLEELDIQGYHDKGDGPERLLQWVAVALKTHRLVASLRERERLQGELLANCSHEFRTPLHIISLYAELLLEQEVESMTPSVLRGIKSIRGAARNLSDLVSDFLAYARIDAGVVRVGADWIDLEEVAREMQRLATVLLEEKPVIFVVELHDVPPRFVTDGVKLHTVVRNLVTNAAKFTAGGTIALRIAGGGNTLKIEVRDTGPGIAAEDQERIFEPFRQLDGSATRSHGGVGLGLSLSRRLARLLGGELTVLSEPGVGSTFTLSLPADATTVGTVRRKRDPDQRTGSTPIG